VRRVALGHVLVAENQVAWLSLSSQLERDTAGYERCRAHKAKLLPPSKLARITAFNA
jgi:hypothetical protein